MIKKLTIIPKIVLTGIASVILSTLCDPHLSLNSSILFQLVNAAVPMLMLLMLWAITGYLWIAFTGVAIGLIAIVSIASLKVDALQIDLIFADLTAITGFLSNPSLLLRFIPAIWGAVGVLSFVALVAGGYFLIGKTRRSTRADRASVLAVGILGIIAFSQTAAKSAVIRSTAANWEVYTQMRGAKVAGVVGNVVLGGFATNTVSATVDQAMVNPFLELTVEKNTNQVYTERINGTRPNIIFYQSESLFDPSILCGFPDKSMLDTAVIRSPERTGSLIVPVYGGRTLQTEFEVLTGIPLFAFPGSTFVYYDLLSRPVNSLPRTLAELGYSTVAVHPNKKEFWNRANAMRRMGFDVFYDLDSFLPDRESSSHGFITDMALSESIISILESSSKPTFIAAVSMNNHGPWQGGDIDEGQLLGMPATLSGQAASQMADYLARISDADKALKRLLDYLAKQRQPTLVVFYGDHLPILNSVYDDLCFKNSLPAQQQKTLYTVWANFDIPPVPDNTYSYLLAGWSLFAAGLPTDAHLNAGVLASVTHDTGSLTREETNTLLKGYAALAARALTTDSHIPLVDDERLNFPISGTRARNMLLKMREHSTDFNDQFNDNDLQLNIKDNKITFKVEDRLSALSFRLYSNDELQENDCKVSVSTDGIERIQTDMDERGILTTLKLTGVSELAFEVHRRTQASCQDIRLRISQIACTTLKCGYTTLNLP